MEAIVPACTVVPGDKRVTRCNLALILHKFWPMGGCLNEFPN